MSTEAAARAFMATKQFAVVGASSDPTKFGHTIFKWYIDHTLPATPINPSASEIRAYLPWPSLEMNSYPTLSDLSKLPDPTNTAVSIITPPKVTKSVLELAKKIGVPAVWLQPGTYDAEILSFALSSDNFKAGVGGGHWCVLVHGDAALQGRKDEKL